MNKWIPCLKGKVYLTKKLILYLKGKVDLTKSEREGGADKETKETTSQPQQPRTSAAQNPKKKICATSLILKTARHDKKLWLVLVEAIRAPAMVLDHPGTHGSKKMSLIVVSPCMEWPDKFLSLMLSGKEGCAHESFSTHSVYFTLYESKFILSNGSC
jgi:hypothetical protein